VVLFEVDLLLEGLDDLPQSCEQLGSRPRDFEPAGGSIRNAVVTTAYAAAGRGEPVTGG